MRSPRGDRFLQVLQNDLEYAEYVWKDRFVITMAIIDKFNLKSILILNHNLHVGMTVATLIDSYKFGMTNISFKKTFYLSLNIFVLVFIPSNE